MPKKKGPLDLPVANGQVIAGRYVVSGVIGQGGMGIVLAGRHLELGEKVAIKFLHREHSSFADRFFREARAAARIRSEHVVRIFDVGRLTSGEPYIVMEYLEGEDLDTRVERRGRLDIQFVADTLLDVCQALAEAHASGIVHRDLKPANIFLAKTPGRDSLVKLLDFGVAKVPDAGNITKTASMLGSPIYMSPEQLMATRDVDNRSDIWSLGVILYELLTGEYPFEGDSLVHLAMVIREKETPSAKALRPEIPEGLDAVIKKCLEKDRNNRFKDVSEFAHALVDYASPAVSHSISRIKRIVEEKKERLALASTEADDDGALDETSGEDDEKDDDNLRSTAHVPSQSEREQLAAAASGPRSSPLSASSSRKLSGSSSSPLTASLAAVSHSTTSPSVEVKKRRARIAGFALGGVALLAMGFGGRAFLSSSNTNTPSNGSSLVAEAAALLPPTAPLIPPPEASSAATPTPPVTVAPVVSSAPVVSPAIAPVKPPKPVATPAKSAVTAATPPPPAPAAENCDPPWIIDENGIKRPKKNCK